MASMIKSTGVGHFVAKYGDEEVDQCKPNFNVISYAKEIVPVSSAV